MPVADDQHKEGPQDGARRRLWPRRWRTRIASGVAVLALIGGTASWINRERIARDVIDGYLTENGVAATYDIVAITPQVQVIENLVVGDPARPDLTVRRMVVDIGFGWNGPLVDRITIDGARAFASYRGGRFSMGALDPLVFTGSDEPPALPAITMVIRDSRALLESDYGRVGVKLDGAGRLDDGFAGTLAVAAPNIGVEGCRAGRAKLYGNLTTSDGAPRLAGPLRLGELECGGASMAEADIGTALRFTNDFSGGTADFRAEGSTLAIGTTSGEGLSGTAKLQWGGNGLALAHDLALTAVTAPQGRMQRLAAKGEWRGRSDLARGEWDGTITGTGLQPGADLSAALSAAEAGSQGTLIAPLLAKARSGLERAVTGGSIAVDTIIRHNNDAIAVIIPEASLASRSGTPVLALSQASAAVAGGTLTGLRGNMLVGGEGLPDINARIEQTPGQGWTMRLAMADYEAGANRLSIPRLALRQERSGAIRFDGLVTASGDLPGGGISDLTVPLEGTWMNARGLALGTRCTPVRFDRLGLSGLTLRAQAISLCPEGAAPILAYNNGLRVGAATGPVNLSGSLGESPATISANAVKLRYPAPFAVEGLSARIGAPGSEMRLSAASLTGSLAGDIGGAFSGGAGWIDAVPLDLADLGGRWSSADGALQVDDAAFTLTDRPAQGEARFNPLVARGASLRLVENRIAADAVLRHPSSARAIADVTIAHNLDTATGNARFTVPGLAFDKALQPEDLSYLAKGVIAFADGTVTGDGRIEWTGDAITSGGIFRSAGLDFAAAFGPVRGLAGEVVFTDLLNLTTAPDQTVRIAAINPGVEVLDGRVQFEVRDGTLLTLEDARFPFMGGALQMRPLVMDFSQPEERRYVFEIVGLDAATFVAQMDLTNLGATGVFDGTVPIIFDKDGNGRIEGGLLLSRAPGGNIAYIGELTYENLGAMGNYAFQALRSLDYRQISIGLNGRLSGEIITNFQFDGVQQGSGTTQNFVTRRLAKLPIRFKVNVRSENFYELATMVRSFWDADYLGNPVDKGLLSTQGGRFVPAGPAQPALPQAVAPALPPAVKPVQPSESESQP
jgi:hypothetical protein